MPYDIRDPRVRDKHHADRNHQYEHQHVEFKDFSIKRFLNPHLVTPVCCSVESYDSLVLLNDKLNLSVRKCTL